MNMDMIKVGPIGGTSTTGIVWDEKGKGEIAKIFVTGGTDSNFVCSLQFLYVDHNGQYVLSDRHGAPYNYTYATTFNTIVLDYPSEFLIGIKGTTYANCLRSITFVTNRGTYGPYGNARPMDKEIDIQIGNGRSFGGFHGVTQNTFIESIGLYLKPINPSIIKPTPVKRPNP